MLAHKTRIVIAKCTSKSCLEENNSEIIFEVSNIELKKLNNYLRCPRCGSIVEILETKLKKYGNSRDSKSRKQKDKSKV